MKEVKKLIELSQIMAEAMPEYTKKLPKKEDLANARSFFFAKVVWKSGVPGARG